MPIRYLLLVLGILYSASAHAVCQAAQSLAVSDVTHQSAMLRWDYYVSNSPSFQAQWRPAGSAGWVTSAVSTISSTSLTGLTNNTTYEWRVRTICAPGDTSVFANGAAFQTSCVAPVVMNVTNITHQSAQLSWYRPVGGATYEVQWRSAGASSWTVINGLTEGILNLTGLPGETTFEWKVRTVCSATENSDFVAGNLFRTRCLSPTNSRIKRINPEAVELAWDSPTFNVPFDLQWRRAGTSAWTLVEDLRSTEYVLTGLTDATTYEWQVRTACSATDKSIFAEIQAFSTSCPLPAEVRTSNVSYNSARLEWTTFAAELQWRAVGAANWNTVSNARSPYSLMSLANNTVYEWRVRTSCSPTESSAFSSTQLLTTRCAAPAYTYASAGQSNSLEFSWESSGSNLFDLQWRIAGTTNWTSVNRITGAFYRLTGLLPETTYEWRVRNRCSETEYSEFLLAQPVTVRCLAPGSLRTENPTRTTIDLVWDSQGGAPGYEVQWRPVGTANWSNVTGIATTRYTLTELQLSATYEWRVRTVCSGTAMSEFSYPQTFSLQCGLPSYFSVSNIDISSARVGWFAFDSHPSYELQYRPQGANGWTSIQGLTTTGYSLTGLTPNTTYEWRVGSYCAVDFSPVQTFRTGCSLPIAVNVTNIDFNSARLSWQNTTQNRLYEINYREAGTTNWLVIRPEGIETDNAFGEDVFYSEKGYTLYNLLPGKTYEWRIRTQCATSAYSDFVSGPSFDTRCYVPSSLYASQILSTSLRISWNPTSTLLTEYDLQWRMVGSADWTTISGITDNNFILTNLIPGNTYEYRVRRICSAGVLSDYSETGTATIAIECKSIFPLRPTLLNNASVLLSWTYYEDEPESTSDIQYRNVNSQEWTTISGIIGTTYSLIGLSPNSTYEWQIRNHCSADLFSAFASGLPFTAACLSPYPASLATQISANSATLSWTHSSLSTQSHIVQWRVSGMTSWSSVTVPSGDYQTSYTLTGLTNNTSYEWRVASDCGGGNLSDFSGIQSFQTSCRSVAYTNMLKVGYSSAQVSWESVPLPAGETYTVQYRISGRVIWSEVTGITSTSALLTGLAGNATYEWRVKTRCDVNGAILFSGVSTFSTYCANPTDIRAINVTARSFLLSWANQPDNTVVNLQVRYRMGTGSWIDTIAVNGLNTSFYLLTDLTPGTTYEYQLQGVCDANALAPPLGFLGSITTPGGSSALNLQIDSLSAQIARLNWSDGPERTNYVLQWRQRNGSWNTTGLLSARRYLLTNLTPNTTYDIRLSYVDDAGVTHEATTSFATTCHRPFDLTTSSIASTSARLGWNANNLPVTIQWRVAGTIAWQSVSGIASTTYSLTGLADHTIYEWRAVTECSANVRITSATRVFRTICQMPSFPYAHDMGSQSAQLSWTGSGPAYSVRYRVAGTSNWTTLTGITSASHVLTGLTNNTSYEWAVATVCEPNTSTTYTSSLRFKTGCAPANNLRYVFGSPDRVYLIWEGAEPTYQIDWRAVGSTSWTTIPVATSPYLLTGLINETAYEWRVRTECGAMPSAQATFTPRCNYNSYESKFVSGITTTSAQLRWTVQSLPPYSLRWRKLGDPNWTNVTTIATSPYTLTGLANNTLYEWQLLNDCSSYYNTVDFFQTRCSSPSRVWTENTTATSVLFRWNDSGEGAGYQLRWRAVGSSDWNIISNIIETHYQLTGLTNNTSYEWQVSSQCGDERNFQITTSFKTLNDCQSGLQTVRDGSWDDPTVWSCNRVPDFTDVVQLNHAVSVPANQTAKALTIRYGAAARISFGTGAILRLKQ